MDASLQMKQVLIIGNSGFIGRHIQSKVDYSNFATVGISSKFIEFKNSKEIKRISRTSTDLDLDIRNAENKIYQNILSICQQYKFYHHSNSCHLNLVILFQICHFLII